MKKEDSTGDLFKKFLESLNKSIKEINGYETNPKLINEIRIAINKDRESKGLPPIDLL